MLSSAVAVLALVTASRVVSLGGNNYTREFSSGWWGLACCSCPLLQPAPVSDARQQSPRWCAGAPSIRGGCDLHGAVPHVRMGSCS